MLCRYRTYLRWILGLSFAFTLLTAQADVYTNCQALLVHGDLAQQGELLHQVLSKYSFQNRPPAYFMIGKYHLAVIPSEKYSSLQDLLPIDDELTNLNEEWQLKSGQVSIIKDIKLNNLPSWTGRFIFTEGLGLFFLGPLAQGQDIVTIGSISTVTASFSYLFANAFDGPDTASMLAQYFSKLDVTNDDFTPHALFVIKAPPHVITALRAFSHFKRNGITYYPRPWIDRKTFQQQEKARKALAKQVQKTKAQMATAQEPAAAENQSSDLAPNSSSAITDTTTDHQ